MSFVALGRNHSAPEETKNRIRLRITTPPKGNGTQAVEVRIGEYISKYMDSPDNYELRWGQDDEGGEHAGMFLLCPASKGRGHAPSGNYKGCIGISTRRYPDWLNKEAHSESFLACKFNADDHSGIVCVVSQKLVKGIPWRERTGFNYDFRRTGKPVPQGDVTSEEYKDISERILLNTEWVGQNYLVRGVPGLEPKKVEAVRAMMESTQNGGEGLLTQGGSYLTKKGMQRREELLSNQPSQ